MKNTTPIVRRLDRKRRVLGLSYVELSDATGIPRERLSHALSGPSDSDMNLIEIALRAYGGEA